MAELEKQIAELKAQKANTEYFGQQMLISDKIHNIQMKINGVRPTDSYIECVGCGS